MFCRNCGTNLPDSAAFCANCGSATTDPGAASIAIATEPHVEQPPGSVRLPTMVMNAGPYFNLFKTFSGGETKLVPAKFASYPIARSSSVGWPIDS